MAGTAHRSSLCSNARAVRSLSSEANERFVLMQIDGMMHGGMSGLELLHKPCSIETWGSSLRRRLNNNEVDAAKRDDRDQEGRLS